MAIIKRMSSKANVKKIEKYLKEVEKTEANLISSLHCNYKNFAKECELTNLMHNKNKEKSERKYFHVIQSFSPEDDVSPEQSHEIAKEFAEKHFNKHEVLIVTHKDKAHIHNHFVINSLELESGKKYDASPKSLWDMRRHSNELCKKYDLVNSIQDSEKESKNKIKGGELRKIVRGDDVWKVNLKAKIEMEVRRAESSEDFKKNMFKKHKIEVRERTRISKGKKQEIYEYKPEENQKFCSEKRLGTDYGKEHIDGVIGRCEEKTKRIAGRTEQELYRQREFIDDDIAEEFGYREFEGIESEIKQREQELDGQDIEKELGDRKYSRDKSKVKQREQLSDFGARESDRAKSEAERREQERREIEERDRAIENRNKRSKGHSR